jgi:hypothetical protein
MQAHGGGIVEVDNVFYLIGENKLAGSAFQSINCYSSTVSLFTLLAISFASPSLISLPHAPTLAQQA